MAKPEELFVLVKNLTKQEKIYFRTMAGKKTGDKKYILLFDVLENQKSHDEKRLREKLKGERFLKQLPVVKNYLYKAILRSLRSFHDGQKLEAQLRREIRNVEILYEKGLFIQCSRIVTRLYKIAMTKEMPMKLLEILNWKKRLARIQGLSRGDSVEL